MAYGAVRNSLRLATKCPFCEQDIQVWQAKRGKGYVGQCYYCGARFFARSYASFNAFTLNPNWKDHNYKGKAKNGSDYYYDARFGIRAFV